MNAKACIAAQMEPLIAVKRDKHYPDWRACFCEPETLAEGVGAVETMKHKLKTPAGRAHYALRKQTVELVRHHQVGDGLPSVSAAGTRQGDERMNTRLPRMECQAHGRIASAVGEGMGNRAPFCRNQPYLTFHLAAAENILGQNGVELGKRDYIGNP